MELGISDSQLRSIKPYFVPVGTLIGMIILSVFIVNYFWNNISDIRRDSLNASRQKNVLEERLDILQSNQLGIQESQSIVTTALPTRSSSVAILNQILNTANTYSAIVLSDLSINVNQPISEEDNPTANAIREARMDFTIVGEYNDISNFLVDLQTVSPILNMNDVKISKESGGVLEASVNFSSFFADPPTTIPAITEPLEDFTNEEKAVISVIKNYTQPTLGDGQNFGDSTNTGKQNPFVFFEGEF